MNNQNITCLFFLSGVKGVRTDKDMSKYINLVYISNNKKGGVGVRKKNIIHMQRVINRKPNMLMFSKPCVCGSFTHRSTRHQDCVLNPKYEDV